MGENEILALIQKINASYERDIQTFNNSKAGYKQNQAKLKQLEGEVNSTVSELEEAKEDANMPEIIRLQQEVQKKRDELKKLQESCLQSTVDFQYDKAEVGKRLDQVKGIPGMEGIIQEITNKKYDEKIKQVEEKAKNPKQNRDNIAKIQVLINERNGNEHAEEISDYLKNMLDAKNDMKKLKSEMKELDDKINACTVDADKQKLEQSKKGMQTKLIASQKQYATYRSEFMKLTKGFKIEFKEAEVDELTDRVNDGIARRKARPNDYDLKKALEKQFEKESKELKMYEDQIAVFKEGKTKTSQTQTKTQGNGKDGGQVEEQEEKLHWWSFRKRFLRWREKAKQKKIGEGEKDPNEGQGQPQPTPSNDKAHNKFVEELQKSAVVDRIVRQQMVDSEIKAAEIEAKYNRDRKEKSR